MNQIAAPSAPAADSLKRRLACEQLRTAGKVQLRATGSSMLPSIWPGDVLVVEQVRNDRILSGDVVLFDAGRRFVAHRVIARDRSTIRTQGDSVPKPDRPLSSDELLGKVAFILRNGKCVLLSKNVRASDRAMAALFRRSQLATRVAVGVHRLRRASKDHNSNHRAVPCQS
jgi:signal peptidase I